MNCCSLQTAAEMIFKFPQIGAVVDQKSMASSLKKITQNGSDSIEKYIFNSHENAEWIEAK